MKYLDKTKKILISRLRLPGDYAKRMRSEHVKARAASIAEVGLMQLPVVVASTREVICGSDRIAAHQLLGRPAVECRLVEGVSDDDIKRMRAMENLERRHDDQNALRAQLVELRTPAFEDPPPGPFDADGNFGTTVPEITQSPPPPTPPKRGRPKEARAKAREEVAEEIGISPAAVKKSEQRAAKKAEPRQVHDTAAPPALPFYVDAKGVRLSDATIAAIAVIYTSIRDAANLVSRARANLTVFEAVLKDLPPEYGNRVEYQRLDAAVADCGSILRGALPVMACLYCKERPEARPCNACKDTGYLTAGQVRAIPEELLRQGDGAGVFVGPNEFALLSAL